MSPLQIIGMYFINSKFKEQIIMKGLEECVSLLTSAGFKVLGVICDQESIHQKIYRLNRHGDGTLTVGGVSVSLIYDVPHLLKSTRNCFQSKEIKVKIARFEYCMFIYCTCTWSLICYIHMLNNSRLMVKP